MVMNGKLFRMTPVLLHKGVLFTSPGLSLHSDQDENQNENPAFVGCIYNLRFHTYVIP